MAGNENKNVFRRHTLEQKQYGNYSQPKQREEFWAHTKHHLNS